MKLEPIKKTKLPKYASLLGILASAALLTGCGPQLAGDVANPNVDSDDIVELDGEETVCTEPDESATQTASAVTTTETTAETTASETTVSETTAQIAHHMAGDANLDGIVTVSDAVLLARVAAEDVSAKITDEGRANGDCDGVEGISSDDVIMVLKYVAGIIQGFPGGD